MLQDNDSKTPQKGDKRINFRDEMKSIGSRYEREKPLIEHICGFCRLEKEHVFIISTGKGVLAIMATNAVIATQLRMNAAELLESISEAGIWPGRFDNIEVKVRPIYQKQRSRQKALKKISPESARILEESADSVNNPKLAEILKRIAKRHGEKN